MKRKVITPILASIILSIGFINPARPDTVSPATTAESSSPTPLQSEIKDSHGDPWKHREVRLLSSGGTVIGTTTSDEDGIARFQDVTPGNYILEVPGADGAVTRKEVTITSRDNPMVLLTTDVAPENTASSQAQASSQTLTLGKVSVSAARLPTQPGALREDIVATESVNAQEMTNVGATSLTNALTHLPGIDVQVECSVCNVRSITLDNLPGRFTTLELDGVPIFSPVSNAYGLDMIGVNGLERIDIARGAATSLTTPESLAGTVNLVTKTPTQDNAEVDADVGDFGYQRETAYGAKVFDWGAISANVTNDEHDSVDGIGYGISQYTGYHRKLGGVGLYLNDLFGFQVKSRFDHIEEERGGGPLGDDYSAILANTTGNPFNWSAGPHGSPVSNTWVNPSTGKLVEPPYDDGEAGVAQIIFTTRNQFVSTADKALSDDTKLHFAFGWAHHQQASWYGGDSDYWDNQKQGYLDANLQTMFGGLLLTSGINYKFEELRSRSVSQDPSSPYFGISRNNVDAYTYDTPGIYLQGYEAFYDQRLEVNGSIREDDNNNYGAITTPRLDLLWHHSDTLSSRFAIGTGYRLPTSFFEQDHGLLSANNIDRSAARPERSQNASYSLNYADDRFMGTSSLNYTRINDMALFVTDSQNNFELEPAQHPFIVESADGTGTWQVTPSNSVMLGLEGYHYEFNSADAANAALFSRPQYRVHVGYDYDSGPWDYNIRGTLTGPQDLAKWYDYADSQQYNLDGTAKPNWSPSFWVFDTHLLYAFNKWLSFDVGVNNIFNYQQAKHDSFLLLDSTGDLDVVHIWGPNIGRSYYAGVKIYFR